MQRSRFLSSASGLLLAGCPSGDPPVCGPADPAGDPVIVVADDRASFRFGDFTAGANNDCPAPAPPAGLISVTLFGAQLEPPGQAVLTFCLPRPDLLEAGAGGVTVPLLPDTQPAGAGDRIHLIDVQADHPDGCRWEAEVGAVPDGTARFRGLCDDAVGGEPWDLHVDATVTVVETCPGLPDRDVRVTLRGGAVVTPL